MQSRYTEPAASAGVPARRSGMVASNWASSSGLTPTAICRPATSILASPPAGVSDESGGAAEPAAGGVREAVGEVGVGHAAGAGGRLPAARGDVGGGLLGDVLVQVVDHDRGTGGGQLEGDLPADAAAGAGHQRDAVGEG